MFDGITYVDPTYSPIIHESRVSANVVVLNAGPGVVRLRAWSDFQDASSSLPPDINMRLAPGNIRSIGGCLIRASIYEESNTLQLQAPPFAALGWRIS